MGYFEIPNEIVSNQEKCSYIFFFIGFTWIVITIILNLQPELISINRKFVRPSMYMNWNSSSIKELNLQLPANTLTNEVRYSKILK